MKLQEKLIEFLVLYLFENVKCCLYDNHYMILLDKVTNIF